MTTLVLSAAFLVLACVGFANSEPLGGAVGLTAAAGLLAQAASNARTQVLRRQEAPDLAGTCVIGGATHVGQDIALRKRELVSAVLLAIASFAFTYGMWSGLMSLPVSGAGFTTVYPAAGLILGGLCLFELYGRGRRSRRDFLVLSPSAIAITANDKRIEIAWESMNELTLVDSKRSAQAGTRVQWSAAKPSIRIDETCLGAPATLWLLDFYHRHPELRDELSDKRAVARLRNGALVEETARYV
ncbi:hypothetical protein [Gordonia sp. SL306]|uniref:hypothetical protein n=1 Tax=Gordonia sp. SL306 TaxID=2995145 RepID=UPI002271D810|nr:hypothetical protein [Gordonia sp. SL306]WAC57595.1 hypothetical protein OVA31_10350 [Gordonia sp. SL306]